MKLNRVENLGRVSGGESMRINHNPPKVSEIDILDGGVGETFSPLYFHSSNKLPASLPTRTLKN